MINFNPNKELFEQFIDDHLKTVNLTINIIENNILNTVYSKIYERFKLIKNKYYKNDNGEPVINAYHYSQTILFLQCLSHEHYINSLTTIDNNIKQKYIDIANRIYYLNTVSGNCDLFYETNYPIKMFCDHPLGSVIGRAKFDEKASLSFAQNCNIGNNKNIYPVIKGNLVMFPNSSLLGNTTIKGTVVLSNGAYVKDEGELEDILIFGRSPNIIKKKIDNINKFLVFQNDLFVNPPSNIIF